MLPSSVQVESSNTRQMKRKARRQKAKELYSIARASVDNDGCGDGKRSQRGDDRNRYLEMADDRVRTVITHLPGETQYEYSSNPAYR